VFHRPAIPASRSRALALFDVIRFIQVHHPVCAALALRCIPTMWGAQRLYAGAAFWKTGAILDGDEAMGLGWRQ
jgi:hypothetical protein